MVTRQQLVLWFYLATPIFFLLDIIFGWDMRISFLDDTPEWKYSYYLVCLCIGILMWKWRKLEPILGMIEGGVNMLLLTLSVLLPYYAAIEAISSGQTIQTPLNTFSIINYLISGLFLVISLQIRSANMGQ